MGERPRLLDLFCGAGGAAMGYHRAGFEVVGVDLVAQPHYPFEVFQADAFAMVQDILGGCWHENYHKSALPGMLPACLGHFDVIHASPPCQDHTSFAPMNKPNGSGWMLNAIIERLTPLDVPWIVENVGRADIPASVILCGSMFGLRVRRHRKFVSNMALLQPSCQHQGHDFVGVYSDHPQIDRPHPDGFTRKPRAGSLKEAQEAMGIDWGDWEAVRQAIPPAYTEFIGRQLIDHVAAGTPPEAGTRA